MFARLKRRCNRLKTQLIDRLDVLLEIFALRHLWGPKTQSESRNFSLCRIRSSWR